MAAQPVEHLVLAIEPLASVFAVLAPYEQKGFEVVGVKSRGGGAVVALRASPTAIAAGRALAAKLTDSPTALPPGTSVRVSQSAPEALQWMFDAFDGALNKDGVSREVVQWEPDEEEADLKAPSGYGYGEEPLPVPHGAHNGLQDSIKLSDLLAPGAVGTETGRRFCAQLRRDSYVPLVLTAKEHKLLEQVERGATGWFAQEEEDKEAQGGAYGHVDRKFTGYRNGKYREQLEVRQTLEPGRGGLYPLPEVPARFGDDLRRLIYFLDAAARGLLRHIADDVTSGGDDGFFEGLLDPPPQPSASVPRQEAKENAEAPPALGHSLIRLCRYDAEDEGVYGSHVLCEQHNDVGFITLDACASVAGLEAFRRSDGLWVPVEHAPPRPNGELVVLAMVGDTLGRLTANYYAPCKHRVVQPPTGLERIGLPFLFRGRSDAVLNTQPTRDACKARGVVAHLADMETTTIKELPAFDSARAILRGWFRSNKKEE
jgi:hypothetical protein